MSNSFRCLSTSRMFLVAGDAFASFDERWFDGKKVNRQSLSHSFALEKPVARTDDTQTSNNSEKSPQFSHLVCVCVHFDWINICMSKSIRLRERYTTSALQRAYAISYFNFCIFFLRVSPFVLFFAISFVPYAVSVYLFFFFSLGGASRWSNYCATLVSFAVPM